MGDRDEDNRDQHAQRMFHGKESEHIIAHGICWELHFRTDEIQYQPYENLNVDWRHPNQTQFGILRCQRTIAASYHCDADDIVDEQKKDDPT